MRRVELIGALLALVCLGCPHGPTTSLDAAAVQRDTSGVDARASKDGRSVGAATPPVGDEGVEAGAASPPDAQLATVDAPTGRLAGVWAIPDGDELERDSPAPAQTSTVWDGQRIHLFAARNEIVSFQLIARAADDGILRLSAALPALTRRGGTEQLVYRPPAADPTDFRGRPIQIFTVGYQQVERPTDADWIFVPGSASAPADPTGRKPVQLIPENARAGHGGLPIGVVGNELQAIWFDVYTGRDLPAGIYEGTVTVTADGDRREIPIELELLDFALPDENDLTVMLYYESDQPVLYQGRDMDALYHRFAHRQRVELVNAYDLPTVQAKIGRFDGDDFTTAAGYEGPGEKIGNRLVPASFYGPGTGWDDRATAWQRADGWMTFLEGRLPRALTFLYMVDEPSAAAYPGIQLIAKNIHGDPGPGKALPIFATTGYVSGLDGAVDIWCSNPNRYDPVKAAAEHAKGHDWWVYNGGRPAGPVLVIDAPGTDPRVVGWMAFKGGVNVFFYWHAVHWRHNSQKKIGDRNQDIWGNPVTFDSRDGNGKGDFANGEGVLIYPGTELLHPDQDRGIAGPINSVRLANLRRGLQDHLYLSLARKRGLEPLVTESLQAIVPRVFIDAAKNAPVSFPETTDSFEKVRLKLGRALAAPTK